MWIFGYGSLMWDGWEVEYGCTRRIVAKLSGYCRSFNKASIRNWGTRANPGPTLNLIKASADIVCQGIAFEFPDTKKSELLSYLEKREGKDFPLHELMISITGQSEVLAFVPIYKGKYVIDVNTPEEITDMVLEASGTEGKCLDYVKGVANKLSELNIDDPVVIDFWRKVNDKLTIPERVKIISQELDARYAKEIKQNERILYRGDILRIAAERGINPKSVLPADYCDNGITAQHSRYKFLHRVEGKRGQYFLNI